MANSKASILEDSPGSILAFCGLLALFGLAVAFTVLAIVALAPLGITAWLFWRDNPLTPNVKLVLLGLTFAATAAFYFALSMWFGVAFLGIIGIAVAIWRFNHPWFKGKKAYDDYSAKYDAARTIPPHDFRRIQERIGQKNGVDVSQPIIAHLYDLMESIYQEDYRTRPLPALPPFDLRYDKHQITMVMEEAGQALAHRENEVERALRTADLAAEVAGVVLNVAGEYSDEGPLYTQIAEVIPDVRPLLRKMIGELFDDKYADFGVGDKLREKYISNVMTTSAKFRSEKDIQLKGDLDIWDHPGTNPEIAEDYLSGTGLLELFTIPVTFTLPEALRPEHGVIVAGSGGGKSQLLESLILADLEDEARPGVILIDSKGEMIERIARLDYFHPLFGALRDRLIIIDHKDKPALNMFDVDPELVSTKINEIAALMRYFFGGLFGSELSDQMDVLFLPLLHMILRMPGATLHTFAELVEDPRKYPDVLERIPAGPRAFILNHYHDRGYAVTKTGIVTRLHRIINEVTLDDMFSAPNNAVDIGQALNDGKIILVSTDAEGLQDLSPVFGKYFIAQVMNAGLARGSRQRSRRRPIHFYIDECAPYVDDKLAQMLTTIRSYGIGVMMAFQGQWQMKTYTSLILGNTAIKIMGSVEDDGDARAFANSMRTSSDFIMAQRKQGSVGHFACYTRELPRAVAVQLEFGSLDSRCKQMDESSYLRLRSNTREALKATDANREGVGQSIDLPPSFDAQVETEAAAEPEPKPQRARRPPKKSKVNPDVSERTETRGDWEP